MTRQAVATVHVTSKLSASELMDAIINDPLPNMFVKWGPFPAVTDSKLRGGAKAWDRGASRLVSTSDGNSMVEEFLQREPGLSFAYRIYQWQGVFGFLITDVDDMWSFEDAMGGSAATWRWVLRARPGKILLLKPLVRLWEGYMERILRDTVQRLEAARTSF